MKPMPEVKVSAAIITRKPFHIYIRIEGDAPKAMNKVMRSHWTKNHKETERWKHIVGTAVERNLPWSQLEKVQLTLKRSSHRMFDYDGLVASFKPIVDGLKDLVIEDDRWELTGAWSVQQEFRPKKLGPLVEVWVKENREG